MNPNLTIPMACLLAFAAWTIGLLLLGVGPYRVGKVLMGKAKSSHFPGGVLEGPDWYQRLLRAHMNCVENLPVFGALVLVGHAVGLHDGLFATLCQVVVAARAGQTVTHLASGRATVINIRFAFFLTQLGCFLTLGGLILRG